MKVEEARRELEHLSSVLTRLTEKDTDQDVRGIAIPVLDAVIGAVRLLVPGHPAVESTLDAISAELVLGEPVRAADALIVVEALRGALPPRAIVG